jgi:hypothetical protein
VTPPDVSPRKGPNVQKRKKPAEVTKVNPDSPDYRKMLIKKAKELKKEGTAFAKIAEIFNEEKLPTLSGKGKWYSGSITWLLSVEK